jgi:organic radical activating enzyme
MIFSLLKKVNKFIPESVRLALLPHYRRLLPGITNIIFLPQLRCQYTCPYCIWNRFTPDDFKAAYHSAAEWHAVFQALAPAAFTITGGEPLLYRDFTALMEGFPGKHMVSSIVSNLGVNLDTLISLRNKNFRIMFSFHPSMTTKEACVKNLLLLKRSGFSNITVNFVAYPEYLSQISGLKRYFEQETGLFFRVDTYKDPDRQYTQKDILTIRDLKKKGLIARDRTEVYDFMDFSRKSCKAGSLFLVIISNGNVYSCIEGYYYSVCQPYKGKKHTGDSFYLGNVFDSSFKFRTAPTLCQSQCAEICDIELAGVRKVIS